MNLPCCWNCRRKYQWKELFLRIKPCPSCGEKQYLTKESRFQTLLFAPISSFLIFTLFLLELSLIFMISIVILLLIVTYSIFPYLYRFTDREQPYV